MNHIAGQRPATGIDPEPAAGQIDIIFVTGCVIADRVATQSEGWRIGDVDSATITVASAKTRSDDAVCLVVCYSIAGHIYRRARHVDSAAISRRWRARSGCRNSNGRGGIAVNRVIGQGDGSAAVDCDAATVTVLIVDGIVCDDIAAECCLGAFQFNAAPVPTRTGGNLITLDPIILNNRCSALDPDATAEQIAHVAGDDVVADRRIAVVHGDSAAVIAAAAARDGKAVNRRRDLRCLSVYSNDGYD